MFGMLMMIAQAAAPGAAPPPPARQVPVARSEGLPAAVSGYFAGRWTGSGAFVNGTPLASTFAFEPLDEGRSLLVRHAEAPPHAFAYVALWSADTASGDIVMMMAGNLKGGARLFRSGGWEGDSLVFRPDGGLRSWWALERITITRESPTRFKARYEMSRDGTRWGGGDEQVFTKAG